MTGRRISEEVMARVVAGESVSLPLDSERWLQVIRVGNSVRLTPTMKMATIKAPGAPEVGEVS